ncbi:Hybrid signal transduction histidine kinase B [Hyphodiscus hymeniophilus]|uniref:Hybrid signal transduction histidine kinase B n=1 Tax=Hyphodiscus hymeniophilus TaxID=353542 RepID=A0A9P7B0A2_9HELO|nr:Hybrid signal transduction histidine kinase B [Hyphodiscus hymeniophilus]
MEGPAEGKPAREFAESQRALELRKFFVPYLSQNQIQYEPAFNESLNGDGALSAYAETIVWRLGGVKCMISLIDGTEQYFIAGATRSKSSDGEDHVEDSTSWFGCDTVPTPGGLCENTLAVDGTTDSFPCFIVNDLLKDDRFASLPVVDGSVAAYRFYAGTPITTRHGVNIGSLFMFDDMSRAGLNLKQKKHLHETAAKVMRHLETKREAAERRRVAMMSQGISKFLEGTADAVPSEPSITEHERPQDKQLDSFENTTVDIQSTDSNDTDVISHGSKKGNETVLDKIRLTLDHAAEVLRESLELTAGGVVFLDTAISYTDIGDSVAYVADKDIVGGTVTGGENAMRPPLKPLSDKTTVRSSDDLHKSTKILAMSAATIATWDPRSRVLDGKTLNTLIDSYPKGNIWYIGDEGYFSSLEQIHGLANSAARSPSGKRRSVPIVDVTKQNSEATMLSQIFHKAKQIMFLPLWDAGGERWYSGCFVWSRSAIPVWTVESEIAYLSAFTNSVMVELSRLDAIISNKMKSDFISSISHEFRSPLHGILASAEFLRDSVLDASQIELISTIQNCSGTLLDTINHVLDYSKINSFENGGSRQGNISNELYQNTNLALLCEDLINGMIAAGEFRSAGSADPSIPVSNDLTRDPRRPSFPQSHSAVEIILDIENNDDWSYKIQAGALRRVIMNIFGNAQKYTKSGYILVEVKMRRGTAKKSSTGASRDILLIKVRDTGRGMSSEYMERKLYHPFAQEDSFAPGVGLGLSIVWSIINQLGGKIQIRSELGKGTDCEITMPCDRPDGSELSSRPDDLTKLSADAQEAIISLRKRAAGKTVLIARHPQGNVPSHYHDVSWTCIARYCSDWFGYEITTSQEIYKTVDLVITDHEEDWVNAQWENRQRTLVVHESMICSQHHKKTQSPLGSICTPIGPFKLARSILSLLEQELPSIAPRPSSTSDRGTQTPLASPEDRMSNGLPMTDYGFTEPLISPLTTITDSSEAPLSMVSVLAPTSPAPYTQDEGVKQAIASLGALSLRLPLRPNRAQKDHSLAEDSGERTSTDVKPHNIPEVPINALHILAVDDNALNLQLIHRYLSKRSMDIIVTARNGIEALNAVREEANKRGMFDVIFMDISMPEMDGFEATRLIRSLERSLAHRPTPEEAGYHLSHADDKQKERGATKMVPATPALTGRKTRAYVVALTGLASRRDRVEAELSGFDDFLTKPIAFGKIGELLSRLSKEKGERRKEA